MHGVLRPPRRPIGSRSGVPLAISAAVVTIVALLGACTGSDSAPPDDSIDGSSTEATSTVPVAEPELRASTCTDPSTPADLVRCESLVLPEDRTRPDERQVELPVIRMGTAGDEPPVVYLHGGPGSGAVTGWATWLSVVDGTGRELVVYDQRGGGAATPTLDCPEHDDTLVDALAGNATVDEERSAVGRSLEACHERLRSEGIDLDSYDTPTSTMDLDDLRTALGAERITVIASSYGTRLALDYLRKHPDHVESLVLDSVDPPGAATADTEAQLPAAALEHLTTACADDLACAAAHPDLAASLEQALERVDDQPEQVMIPSPDGGPSRSISVDGNDLVAGLFAAMYDTELIALIPSAIEQLATGDTGLLGAVGPRIAPALTGSATGARMSIDCADLGSTGGPPQVGDGESPYDPGYDAGAVARSGRVRASTVLLVGSAANCDSWPVDAVDARFREPFEIDDPPPSLVIAGELDPITPSSGSAKLAEELDATFIEVPRGGHAPMLTNSCSRTVLRSFLIDPASVDAACADQLEPIPFA